MSKPMKATSVAVLAARAEAFTTWFSLPVRSRLNSASTAAVSTNGGLGDTPDVFGSRWRQTEVPNHWAASSSASLRRARPLLPMTGMATRCLKNEGIFIPPLRNVATCKLPRPSCPSFTSCSNLKTWLRGIHHGVSPQHLQAYLNEFTFRFNRRFYPFNAFRSLLGIAGDVTAPTYAELYAKKSRPTTDSRLGH